MSDKMCPCSSLHREAGTWLNEERFIVLCSGSSETHNKATAWMQQNSLIDCDSDTSREWRRNCKVHVCECVRCVCECVRCVCVCVCACVCVCVRYPNGLQKTLHPIFSAHCWLKLNDPTHYKHKCPRTDTCTRAHTPVSTPAGVWLKSSYNARGSLLQEANKAGVKNIFA